MKKIPLSKGKFALVDDDIFDYLNQWKWSYSSSNGYAVRMSSEPGAKIILMHRIIMQTPEGMETDHIHSGEPENGINNQRENLRICTHAQNLANAKRNKKNTSGYRGVRFFKRDKNWQARITINYSQIHLGYFKTLEDAARAYDEAARKYFGRFAKLNFPDMVDEGYEMPYQIRASLGI